MTEEQYFSEMKDEFERFQKVIVSDLILILHEQKWQYRVRIKDQNWTKTFDDYQEGLKDKEAFMGAVAKCQQLFKTLKEK
jgi:alpha-glucuronidase